MADHHLPPDHLALCQKSSANARFQSIMNEMDRKQRERANKSSQRNNSTDSSSSSVGVSLGGKAKEKYG
jgi:hypothetical protein